MLPLKDDIPTDRVPVVTLALIAAVLATCLVGAEGGMLPLLAAALFLWIFGTSVEDATSRPRFLAFCLLGGAAAIGVGRAVDLDAAAAMLATTGAASAAIGGHPRLYPRARVVTLAPVPTAFLLLEPPAWALAAAWVALQVLFAGTSVTGPLADGGDATLLAAAAALALGALAAGPLARRRKVHPPPLATRVAS